VLNLLLGPRRTELVHDEDQWPSSYIGGRKTLAGVNVNESLALTLSAVWCASRVLAEPGSDLPLMTYERTDNENREPARNFSLYSLLKDNPNSEMGSSVFREGRTLHQVNWGNGFAEIERADRYNIASEVVSLWPIHPSRVRPVNDYDYDLKNRPLAPEFAYIVNNDDGSQVAMRASEMLHVPGALSEDGVWGKGVIGHAREAIGGCLAVNRHGYAYFGTGAQPRGVIMAPGMKDPEQRRQFRKEWKEIHGSPDSGEIAILPVESKYNPIFISNEDSQFLQTREFDIREIARWYKIPPYMLADLMRDGHGSIEHMGMEFVIYSLMPWLRKWEEQINLKLLNPLQRKRYFVEHNLNGLLRGDIATRMAAYNTAIMIGVMTINECRRLENLNGIGADGDVHYVPMNVQTAEQARKGENQVQRSNAPPGSDQTGRKPMPDPTNGQAHAGVELMQRELGVLPETKMVSTTIAVAKPRRAAMDNASRLVLTDVLSRMFRKEANAATRAAKGNEFDKWLAEFYDAHEPLLADALAPACSVLDAAGLEYSSSFLSVRLVAESKAELRLGYNADTPSAFALRLESWPTKRAQETASKILLGGYGDA
jgi:HK97 family phage portal protein